MLTSVLFCLVGFLTVYSAWWHLRLGPQKWWAFFLRWHLRLGPQKWWAFFLLLTGLAVFDHGLHFIWDLSAVVELHPYSTERFP